MTPSRRALRLRAPRRHVIADLLIQTSSDTADNLSSRGVTIVVPAYNEEGGIEGVVERLCGLELGVPTRVLVVNDGSTDGTRAALKRLDERFPTLDVIEHRRNQGYGAALKTGFSHAETEVVVITDADGTYPEDRIPDLLKLIDEGCDMAVGARLGADVNIPLIRKPTKAALRHLASFLAGARIPDLNSGLRAFRRDFVLEYRPILPNGFSFTTTITLAAMTNNHVVEYITIDYAHRSGSSKIRPIRDTLGFTALIIRTVLYFNPLKVFYPLTLFLVSILLALVAHDIWWENPPNLGDKTVLMFVACVQVLTVGLLADLIEKKSRL